MCTELVRDNLHLSPGLAGCRASSCFILKSTGLMWQVLMEGAGPQSQLLKRTEDACGPRDQPVMLLRTALSPLVPPAGEAVHGDPQEASRESGP